MVRRHEKSKTGCCALEGVLCFRGCVVMGLRSLLRVGIEELRAVRWRGRYALLLFESMNMMRSSYVLRQ